MPKVQVDSWSVAALQRVLEQYRPDAVVVVGWRGGDRHILDTISDQDGMVVLGADWAGAIAR